MNLRTTLLIVSSCLICLDAAAQAPAQAIQVNEGFYCASNTTVREMTKACSAHNPALTKRVEAAYATWYRRNKVKSKARVEACLDAMKKAAPSGPDLERARKALNAQNKASYAKFKLDVAASPDTLCTDALEQVEKPGGRYDLP